MILPSSSQKFNISQEIKNKIEQSLQSIINGQNGKRKTIDYLLIICLLFFLCVTGNSKVALNVNGMSNWSCYLFNIMYWFILSTFLLYIIKCETNVFSRFTDFPT